MPKGRRILWGLFLPVLVVGIISCGSAGSEGSSDNEEEEEEEQEEEDNDTEDDLTSPGLPETKTAYTEAFSLDSIQRTTDYYHMTKLFTIVHPKSGTKTIHFMGLPPALTEGKDERKSLPLPDILIIEGDEKDAKGFLLYRYTKAKEYCGDTWHQSIEDAKAQAKFEYGHGIGEWQDIPESENSLTYAISKIKS